MIHPYQIFLELNDIEHRRTKIARPRTNGFVERFNRTVFDEFLREPSVKSIIPRLRNSRKTWTNGSIITITKDRTEVIATWADVTSRRLRSAKMLKSR